MARIKHPVIIANWFTLYDKVKTKHDADAAASVLIPYFTEQGKDLDDYLTKRNEAEDAHVLFLQLEKDSERETEKRNKLFETVFDDHKKCVQFLKKLFRSNVHKLGDWGVTVNGSGRIVYATHFLQCVSDINIFIAKHNSYAAGTSPLQAFLDENEIDFAENLTKLTNANTSNTNFQAYSAEKEEQRELRDLRFDPIKEFLRGIGNFLVALYPDLPHKAGDWGFEIDSSPQGIKTRDVILKEGQVRTIHDAVLGSVLRNSLETDVEVFPGKTATGIGKTVPAGKPFIIERNYGTFTIKNLNDVKKGSIKVDVNK